MELHQSRPGKGGKRQHWPYCSTAKESEWEGWYAGGAFWTYDHGELRSKPCPVEITGGALHCPKCAADVPLRLIGYIPVYRCADGKPVVVIVKLDSWDAVLGLTKHDRVTVGRGADQSDATWVRRRVGGPPYVTTLPERKVIPSIVPSLLRLWGVPAITQWWESRSVAERQLPSAVPAGEPAESSDKGMSLSPENGVDRVASEPPAALPAPTAGGSDDPQREKAYEATKSRIRKHFGLPAPSGNGDGKH